MRSLLNNEIQIEKGFVVPAKGNVVDRQMQEVADKLDQAIKAYNTKNQQLKRGPVAVEQQTYQPRRP